MENKNEVTSQNQLRYLYYHYIIDALQDSSRTFKNYRGIELLYRVNVCMTTQILRSTKGISKTSTS